MDPWTILELQPTKDKAVIKKAYAKVIKQYNPEDDPHGFMKVRKAYETILKMVDDESEESLAHRLSLNNDVYGETDEITSEFEIQPEKSQFMNELAAVYNDFFKRINVKEWEKLFQGLSIVEYQQLNDRICEFFNENNHLPKDVWNYLNEEVSLVNNNSFQWEEFLYEDFGLTYNYFNPSVSCDYDRYVQLRYAAVVSLKELEYETALNLTVSAVSIFTKDPAIYRIMGISYYKLKDYQNALLMFSKGLELNPQDMDITLKRGYAFLKVLKYKLAIKDFETVLKKEPMHGEAYKGSILCLVGLKKIKEANYRREIFYKNGQERDIELDLILYECDHEVDSLKEEKVIQKALKILIRYIVFILVIFFAFILGNVLPAIIIIVISLFIKKALFKKEIKNGTN